jgi:uncharacterized membrane protein YfcA
MIDLSLSSKFLLPATTLLVAFLYSAVGHGGASGYLAILSYVGTKPDEAATTALILNLLVAGLAFFFYARAGHFSAKLTLPFIIPSIPCAFLGGLLVVPTQVYELLLAITLLVAAMRLAILTAPSGLIRSIAVPSWTITACAGAAIGLISGIVGVGGGIFLSPLLLLMNWADAKKTGATSACFIIVNALAGLFGRAARHSIFIGDLLPLLTAGLIGGLLGSFFGANYASNTLLRRLLAVALVVAACKLLLKVF